MKLRHLKYEFIHTPLQGPLMWLRDLRYVSWRKSFITPSSSFEAGSTRPSLCPAMPSRKPVSILLRPLIGLVSHRYA